MSLLDVMTSNKNAMKAYDYALRIDTANMGNVETTGYKGTDYSFQTIFNQVVSDGTGSDPLHATGGTNPFQLGSSVSISGINLNFEQGDIGDAGPLSAAILGSGLFVVQGEDGKLLYTRAGEFNVDNQGYVVDSKGRKVLGYKVNDEGQPVTSELVPIKTDGNTDVGWQCQEKNGMLITNYSNYKLAVDKNLPLPKYKGLYQLALTSFPNRAGLVQYDGTTFKETTASGRPMPYKLSGQDYGEILPQSKEKSNVFYIGETIDSLAVQRAMSASLTAIKIANQQIQTIVQQLGT